MSPSLIPLLPLLFQLPFLAHSSKILVIATAGSHLYAASEVASSLVSQGHNVTLFSFLDDPHKDFTGKGFDFTALKDKEFSVGYLNEFQGTSLESMNMESTTMLMNLMIGNDMLKEAWINSQGMYLEYFTSQRAKEFFDQGNFDLVIVEELVNFAFSSGLKHLKIPIVNLFVTSNTFHARNKAKLPWLLNSEPNMVYSAISDDTPPSFYQRSQILYEFVRYASFVPTFVSRLAEFSRYPIGVDDLDRSIADVILIMDHPVLSYPYLSPPNTFYLGFFHLHNKPTQPLPDLISKFISECPRKHIFYMSFGTFLRDIAHFKQLSSIIRSLSAADACVIVKSSVVDLKSASPGLPATFLQLQWVPQQDLLASGALSMFISHCGNNGRIESIYYRVPILCIPLFADQLHNAHLVKYKKFGEYLVKEQLTESSFTAAVDGILGNREIYKGNMERAVDYVTKDPGAGVNMLHHQIEQLLKIGNGDHLKNKIIGEQWSYEIYNLDFLGLFFLVVLLVLILVWKLCKACCCCIVRHVGKEKAE